MTTSPHRIVCAVDGSDTSLRGVDLVAGLPLRRHDEVIVASRPAYVLAARPGDESLASRLATSARERAHIHVDVALARLGAKGITARGVLCEGEDAVDGILRTVDDEDASLLVVGSRGRGAWGSILLGSTARALAITSRIPVLVVRAGIAPPRRVLVATDDSLAARAAITAFARLPLVAGVAVELLHVLPLHDWRDGDDELWAMGDAIEHDEEVVATAALDAQLRLLPSGVTAATHLTRGHVGETIVDRAADTGADLVVIGTRGSSGPRSPLFGSTAERVLAHARCNVLISPVDAGSPG